MNIGYGRPRSGLHWLGFIAEATKQVSVQAMVISIATLVVNVVLQQRLQQWRWQWFVG